MIKMTKTLYINTIVLETSGLLIMFILTMIEEDLAKLRFCWRAHLGKTSRVRELIKSLWKVSYRAHRDLKKMKGELD